MASRGALDDDCGKHFHSFLSGHRDLPTQVWCLICFANSEFASSLPFGFRCPDNKSARTIKTEKRGPARGYPPRPSLGRHELGLMVSFCRVSLHTTIRFLLSSLWVCEGHEPFQLNFAMSQNVFSFAMSCHQPLSCVAMKIRMAL